MRVIALKTIKNSWKKHPPAEQALKSWYDKVVEAKWSNPNDLKRQIHNASVLTGKRIVFNICGNKYRMIVDIEFRLGIVFIVWFGTHKEYDKINAKTIEYTKSN